MFDCHVFPSQVRLSEAELTFYWYGKIGFIIPKTRAVVKSTFVESKTSPSPKRFESESRPSPKRFESESRPSPKRFESKSSPSPNEKVKTEKVKNNLLQNHIFNY